MQYVENDFNIILANLVVCTSLKAFVELGFVVPYYVLQSDGIPKVSCLFYCFCFQADFYQID